MKKLKELVALCKCSVTVSINDHKDYYETVKEHISEEEVEDIDKDVFDKMIEKDTIVHVQAYTRTPVGFYVIYHYDIDKAINQMIKIAKGESDN